MVGLIETLFSRYTVNDLDELHKQISLVDSSHRIQGLHK